MKDCYPHVVTAIASFHPQAHLDTALAPKAICNIKLLNDAFVIHCSAASTESAYSASEEKPAQS